MVQFIIWVFSIVLAVIGVVGAIYLSGLDLFSVASYRTAIPTLHFIAFTSCVSASTEAFETALKIDVPRQAKKEKVIIVAGYLLMVALSLVFCLVFARSVIDLTNAGWMVSTQDVVVAFAMIAGAVIANWAYKSQLNRLESAGNGVV